MNESTAIEQPAVEHIRQLAQQYKDNGKNVLLVSENEYSMICSIIDCNHKFVSSVLDQLGIRSIQFSDIWIVPNTDVKTTASARDIDVKRFEEAS